VTAAPSGVVSANRAAKPGTGVAEGCAVPLLPTQTAAAASSPAAAARAASRRGLWSGLRQPAKTQDFCGGRTRMIAIMPASS